MKLKTLVCASMACIALFSCDSNTYFDEHVHIEGRSWALTDKPTFKVHITDASKKYDVIFQVRHSADYPYANFFVLLYQNSVKMKTQIFRKELKLANSDGKWTGKSAGSLYTQQSVLHKDYQFPDTGIYNFTFEQNMRDNPLKEITDIGLTIIAK